MGLLVTALKEESHFSIAFLTGPILLDFKRTKKRSQSQAVTTWNIDDSLGNFHLAYFLDIEQGTSDISRLHPSSQGAFHEYGTGTPE